MEFEWTEAASRHPTPIWGPLSLVEQGVAVKPGDAGHVAHLINKWLPVDPESLLHQESHSLYPRKEGRRVAGFGLKFGATSYSVTDTPLNFSECTFFTAWS